MYPSWYDELKELKKKIRAKKHDYYAKILPKYNKGLHVKKSGCCLLCYAVEDDCLCIHCRCSGCLWYNDKWAADLVKRNRRISCSLIQVSRKMDEKIIRYIKKEVED